MIDFFGSGYDAAEMMGLLPRLQELAYPVDGVAFVDEHARRRAWLDYERVRDALGGRLLPLMRGDLERALFETLSTHSRVTFDRSVRDVHLGEGYVDVMFDDATTDRVDLLVGADGIHSRIRGLLFGAENRYIRLLGYHVASYVFEDAALREALRGGFMHVRSAPGHQLGLYPVRGGKIAALFAFRCKDSDVPNVAGEALRERYADLGWHADLTLAACPPDEDIYYDVVAQIELPSWHRGRVVLVGDACEAVSLLAGQGASMAVGGSCVLASELSAAPDIEAGLSRYQKRVRPAAIKKQASGRALVNWFVPATTRRIAVRDMMINMAAVPGFRWILGRSLARDAESIVSDDDRRRLAILS